MNVTNTCGKRFATDAIQNHYVIERLTLEIVVPSSQGMQVMPNTLTHTTLLPLNANDFEYKVWVFEFSSFTDKIEEAVLDRLHFRSKLENGKKYAASLSLNVPKSDLLTFAIFLRDYSIDQFPNGGQTAIRGGILLVTCAALITYI